MPQVKRAPALQNQPVNNSPATLDDGKPLNGDFDACLVCYDGEIMIHGQVICRTSKVLEYMLTRTPSGTAVRKLDVSEYSTEVVNFYVRHSYAQTREAVPADLYYDLLGFSLCIEYEPMVDICYQIAAQCTDPAYACQCFLATRQYPEQEWQKVTSHCYRLVLKSFAQFINTPSFSQIDVSLLMSILSDRNLKGINQSNLMYALVRWLRYDFENRDVYAEDLFIHFDIAQLSHSDRMCLQTYKESSKLRLQKLKESEQMMSDESIAEIRNMDKNIVEQQDNEEKKEMLSADDICKRLLENMHANPIATVEGKPIKDLQGAEAIRKPSTYGHNKSLNNKSKESESILATVRSMRNFLDQTAESKHDEQYVDDGNLEGDVVSKTVSRKTSRRRIKSNIKYKDRKSSSDKGKQRPKIRNLKSNGDSETDNFSIGDQDSKNKKIRTKKNEKVSRKSEKKTSISKEIKDLLRSQQLNTKAIDEHLPNNVESGRNMDRKVKRSKTKSMNKESSKKRETDDARRRLMRNQQGHDGTRNTVGAKRDIIETPPQATPSSDCITAAQMRSLPEDIRAVLLNLSRCTIEGGLARSEELQTACESTRKAFGLTTTDADNAHSTSVVSASNHGLYNDSSADSSHRNHASKHGASLSDFPAHEISSNPSIDEEGMRRLAYNGINRSNCISSEPNVRRQSDIEEMQNGYRNDETMFDRLSIANVGCMQRYERNGNRNANIGQTLEIYSRSPTLSSPSLNSSGYANNVGEYAPQRTTLTTLERKKLNALSRVNVDRFSTESNLVPPPEEEYRNCYFSTGVGGQASITSAGGSNDTSSNQMDDAVYGVEYDNARLPPTSSDDSPGSHPRAHEFEHQMSNCSAPRRLVDRFDCYSENLLGSRCDDADGNHDETGGYEHPYHEGHEPLDDGGNEIEYRRHWNEVDQLSDANNRGDVRGESSVSLSEYSTEDGLTPNEIYANSNRSYDGSSKGEARYVYRNGGLREGYQERYVNQFEHDRGHTSHGVNGDILHREYDIRHRNRQDNGFSRKELGVMKYVRVGVENSRGVSNAANGEWARTNNSDHEFSSRFQTM